MADLIHLFELANLGKAPFSLSHVEELSRGGSCDFCGTGIRWAFWLNSTDGRRFKVGCDCIHKSGDRGLIDLAERERKERARAARHAKAEAKRRAAQQAAKAAARLASRANALAFKAYVQATHLRQVLVRATHRTDSSRAVAVEFVRKMVAGGTLTHKQHAFLLNLGREYSTTRLTMGKGQVVAGKVIGAWVDDFGTPKLLVETDGGEKVGVTNNHPTVYNPEMRGKTITFTAELQRKHDKLYALRPKGMQIVA